MLSPKCGPLGEGRSIRPSENLELGQWVEKRGGPEPRSPYRKAVRSTSRPNTTLQGPSPRFGVTHPSTRRCVPKGERRKPEPQRRRQIIRD